LKGWICFTNNKIYLRLKDILGPFKVGVFSATSLRLESVQDVDLPIPEYVKARDLHYDTKEDDELLASKEEEDEEDEEDEEEAWERGEEMNFANAEENASIVAASSNFNSTGGIMERNILVDPFQNRVDWNGEGEERFIFSSSDSNQWIICDLGEPRLLSRVGADFEEGEGSHGVSELFTVEVSSDGNSYIIWGELNSSPTSRIFEAPNGTIANEEYRYIRYNFGRASSEGSAITRLHAYGHKKVKKGHKVPFPPIISDGRHVIYVHSGSRKKNESGEREPSLQLFFFDPLDHMNFVRKAELNWGIDEQIVLGAGLATNGSKLLFHSSQANKRSSDDKTVVCTTRLIDLSSGRVISLEDFTYTVKIAVAHSITYDHRNNNIWGWDPFTDKFCRWRNVGLPVPFDPPKPSSMDDLAFSVSPVHRLTSLKANNSGDGRYEAALIMCHLDRLFSPYGPPF
jgi:hypothetical protein